MSFRERMTLPVSKAEDILHARLQREGMHKNMHRGMAVRLDEKRAELILRHQVEFPTLRHRWRVSLGSNSGRGIAPTKRSTS